MLSRYALALSGRRLVRLHGGDHLILFDSSRKFVIERLDRLAKLLGSVGRESLDERVLVSDLAALNIGWC
jgi:hypothetical protein